MAALPRLETERLILRVGEPSDAPALVRFNRENAEHLIPWSPRWTTSMYETAFWERKARENIDELYRGSAARFYLFPKAAPQTVIGLANLNQIVRGVLHGAILGYGLAEEEQGKGYMNEALHAVIRFAFEDLRLHRIAANYMPHNVRSAAVLRKLGFQVEGYARDYLLINGKWQDHILTSLNNPAWNET